MTPESRDILETPLQPTTGATDAERSKSDEERRLEILKQQKELARKEKEQALWREASRMSGLPENKPQTDATVQKSPPIKVRPASGLFAKLGLRKLL